MGRKKKKQTKPWCWYCNREFDDEKILLQHQKARHFKCPTCHKRLFTGPGLKIHCMQVHKEAIEKIPNSIKGRDNVDLEIYGMEGVPDQDLRAHEREKLGSAYVEPLPLSYPSPMPTTSLLNRPMAQMHPPGHFYPPPLPPPPYPFPFPFPHQFQPTLMPLRPPLFPATADTNETSNDNSLKRKAEEDPTSEPSKSAPKPVTISAAPVRFQITRQQPPQY